MRYARDKEKLSWLRFKSLKGYRMKSNSFHNRHPFMFVLALEAIVIGIHLFFLTLIDSAFVLDATIHVILDGSIYVVLTVIAIILLTRLQWWRETGFRFPFQARLLVLFWLPALQPALLVPSLILGQVSATDPIRIAIFFATTLMIGFVEEAFYRGLMLRALLPQGIWRAAIFTTVLFGCSHSINLFFGASWQATVLQVIYAGTIFGFVGAALVIRTGTIVPLVILHFLNNFIAFLLTNGVAQSAEATFGDLALTIVFSAIALIYGSILLTQSKQTLDVAQPLAIKTNAIP